MGGWQSEARVVADEREFLIRGVGGACHHSPGIREEYQGQGPELPRSTTTRPQIFHLHLLALSGTRILPIISAHLCTVPCPLSSACVCALSAPEIPRVRSWWTPQSTNVRVAYEASKSAGPAKPPASHPQSRNQISSWIFYSLLGPPDPGQGGAGGLVGLSGLNGSRPWLSASIDAAHRLPGTGMQIAAMARARPPVPTPMPA